MLLTIGPSAPDRGDPAALLAAAGVRAEAQPIGPDDPAGAVDAAVARLDGRRLVMDADLSGLNLVLHRLLRAGLLEDTETAVLPREPVAYLRRCGVPDELTDQIKLAVRGTTRLVGVVKDDSGGVCVDTAQLSRFPEAGGSAPGPGGSRGWWLRAVVDDQRLADGAVQRLAMRRLAPDRLEAVVRISALRQRRRQGRSLQLSCDPALIVADGVARTQPRAKRTFWSEPKLWRLATPV